MEYLLNLALKTFKARGAFLVQLDNDKKTIIVKKPHNIEFSFPHLKTKDNPFLVKTDHSILGCILDSNIIFGVLDDVSRSFEEDVEEFSKFSKIVSLTYHFNHFRDFGGHFFHLTDDLLGIIGFDGHFKKINPMWCKQLGYHDGELFKTPFIHFVHPDDIPKTLLEFERLKREKSCKNFVNRYRCKNGSYCWMSWDVIVFDDEQAMYCITHNITNSKLYETALKLQISFVEKLNCFSSFESAIPFIIETICKEMDWSSGQISQNSIHNTPSITSESLIFPITAESKILGTAVFNYKIKTDQNEALLILFTSLGKQIGELFLRKAVEEKALLLASIVESSENAIVGKTLDGIIVSWNESARILFGYSKEEILGKSCELLCTAEHKEAMESILQQIKSGKRTEDFETTLIKKGGEVIQVLISYSPILSKSGDVIGISSISHDITKKKKLETLKSEFISMVSHELRTPLTSINGSLSFLQGKTDCTKANHLIEIAHRNSERLVRLVNDILDVEKMELGKMPFDIKEIDLNTPIKISLETVQIHAEKKSINLVLENPYSTLPIKGDIDRLIQVITNLLSNAVKFSPENSTVNIKINQSDSHIRVSISDEGPGIPEEFRPQIFEKFGQADSSIQRQKGSTGLGLNISKLIVNHHAGKIDYVCHSEKGTTFFFDLPRMKNSKAADQQ